MSLWRSAHRSSSSLRSSSRSSSSHSSNSMHIFPILALDFLKTLSSEADVQLSGEYYPHLESDLGERRYRRICNDPTLALKEIHYCQEGLDLATVNKGQEILTQEQVKSIAPVRGLINHDYLILAIETGQPSAEVLYIKAHKIGGDKAGIHINHVPSSEINVVLHEGVRCFIIDCDGGENKHIRMEALLAILKKVDPNYSILSANCWDYAKATAKSLIKACAEVNSISVAEKRRLQKEHDNLERELIFRHIQNRATSLKERIVSFSALKSGSNSRKEPEIVPTTASTDSSDRDEELPSNSSAILDSSRVLKPYEAQFSSQPVGLLAAPTAPTGPPTTVSSSKIWFQIVFLIYWLIMDWLGLRSWAIRVLGLPSTN